MAKTSDGGKSDPHASSNAYTNTNARSPSTQAVPSPKNNPVLTEIDRDNQFFVHMDDDEATRNADWTKVLARYQRCQEPSYAATVADAIKTNTDKEEDAAPVVPPPVLPPHANTGPTVITTSRDKSSTEVEEE